MGGTEIPSLPAADSKQVLNLHTGNTFWSPYLRGKLGSPVIFVKVGSHPADL